MNSSGQLTTKGEEMANYYAAARSNYFAVKDIDELERALEGVKVNIVKDSKGRIAILCLEEGGWPSEVCSSDGETWRDFNIEHVVADHLKDGHVAIFMESGYEKLRYLTGYAIAINNRHEVRVISINDIYSRAGELGNVVTRAEY